INSLWTSAGVTTGPCATQNLGDPVVLYDPLADRWLLSQLASPSHVCIAVSRTPDPVTGGYHLYEFNAGSFPDYFKLGVWPDAYRWRPSTPPCAAAAASPAAPSPERRRRSTLSTSGRCGGSSTATSAATRP